MRRGALFLLGVLLGPAMLAAPVAGAELTILVFITPGGRGIGETIEIFVEVYRHGQFVDPDSLSILVGQPNPYELVVEHTGPGRFHTTYAIQTADISYYGFVDIGISAGIGTMGWYQNHLYAVEGAQWSSGRVTLVARVANRDAVGATIEPGEVLNLEVRTYWNGSLKEAGIPNGTVTKNSQYAASENLTLQRASDGVFRATYRIPANLTNTTAYAFGFSLGDPYTGGSTGLSLAVDPLPCAVSAIMVSRTRVAVEVLAGATEATAGARVAVSGYVFYEPFGFDVLSAVNGTTNETGRSRVEVELPAEPSGGLLVVNVTYGDRTFWRPVLLDRRYLPGEWTPNIPTGSGFMAWLVTNPEPFDPGDAATLKIHVVEGSLPLRDHEVVYFLWRGGATSVDRVGNATTDAEGNFTLEYEIPEDWAHGEGLTLRVDDPSGYGSFTMDIRFEGTPAPGSPNLWLEVSEGAVGSPLRVTAHYTGRGQSDGTEALAYLVPGNETKGPLPVGSVPFSVPTGAVLSREGANFTGVIDVPRWYPPGDFLLVVLASNAGATDELAGQYQVANVTLVHIGPEGSLAPAPVARGFLPAPLAMGALAALGVAALASRRQRAT